MQIEKLFQVLVVGGALLTGPSLLLADASGLSVCSANPIALPTGELQPIFCSSAEACPKDANGKPTVKAGFECCWGTSCEQIANP